MILINIIGPQGSGKTTKAKEIARLYGESLYLTDTNGPFALSEYTGQSVIVCDECEPPEFLFRDLMVTVQRKGQLPERLPRPKVLIVTKNVPLLKSGHAL